MTYVLYTAPADDRLGEPTEPVTDVQAFSEDEAWRTANRLGLIESYRIYAIRKEDANHEARTS